MKRILILLVLLACQAHADIYKSINSDGEVVYSDTATKGAEKLKMQPLPTYTPPALPAPAIKAGQTQEKKDFYQTFVIVSPENEETIRNNLGILNIEARLDPVLQARRNHRVQFFLNGKPYGAPVGKTNLTISNLDRGEYTLSATVVDAEGNALISTGDVVLFMKRHSILNPPKPTPPKPTPLPSAKP
jgi:hypothetical protein